MEKTTKILIEKTILENDPIGIKECFDHLSFFERTTQIIERTKLAIGKKQEVFESVSSSSTDVRLNVNVGSTTY